MFSVSAVKNINLVYIFYHTLKLSSLLNKKNKLKAVQRLLMASKNIQTSIVNTRYSTHYRALKCGKDHLISSYQHNTKITQMDRVRPY